MKEDHQRERSSAIVTQGKCPTPAASSRNFGRLHAVEISEAGIIIARGPGRSEAAG